MLVCSVQSSVVAKGRVERKMNTTRNVSGIPNQLHALKELIEVEFACNECSVNSPAGSTVTGGCIHQ
jgi:hypothetical protein